MKILYFTGTGNSLKVAKSIAKNKEELLSISKMVQEKKVSFKDDVIGIVYPCYAFQSPKFVYDFIKNIEIEAKYLFIIGTNGGGSGLGTHDVLKLLSKKGLKVNYCNEIAMGSNYLPFSDMKEINNQVLNMDIEKNIESIVNDINMRKKFIIHKSIGFKILSPLICLVKFQVNGNVDKNFTLDETCTLCGVCQKVCSTNNIEVNKEVKFKHKCAYCFSCVQNCPTVSMHHKKEKSTERFRANGINLDELFINK